MTLPADPIPMRWIAFAIAFLLSASGIGFVLYEWHTRHRYAVLRQRLIDSLVALLPMLVVGLLWEGTQIGRALYYGYGPPGSDAWSLISTAVHIVVPVNIIACIVWHMRNGTNA
jgi:biotin transporter BioY